MIERHQDYILNLSSVPTSGINQVPLKLDTDAPMAVRLVRSRNLGTSGFRYTTPTGAYQSNALRTDWILPTTSGGSAAPSRGALNYPEFIYPPGATINVDFGNNTGSPITNGQLLFRGSKLFRNGSLWVPTYPERMAILPSVYQVVVSQVPVTGQVLNNVLSIKNDADMVIWCGACDAFSMTAESEAAFTFNNVWVTIRDQSGKAYSNTWQNGNLISGIHVNDLFGQGNTTNGQDDDMLFTPGLFTPEFYLPRRHNLYFDVTRSDASLEGAIPVDLYFRFIGMKVFQR